MRATLTLLILLCIAVTANAGVKEEAISYSANGLELKGYLCYDDASEGKRPGVLIVHEWWGLNDYAKRRARSLAEAGYVAFAVDMYGEGKTTEHPQTAGEWSGAVNDQARNERFGAAHQLLRDHALIDGDRIAAIGYCFGGGAVLREAMAGADVRGVVSFHGSLPTQSVEPGTVKAKILVCHGAADPFVPAEQITKFQQVATEAGADWQFISYGGAKHSFTAKEADERGIPALQYNAEADRRSWAAMHIFLKEVFE